MTLSIIPALESLTPGASWRISGLPVYENLEWFDEEVAQPTEEVLLAEAQRLASLRPWNELRAKRDSLIAETDWWVLPDRTPTQEQLDYRQALRDLPANTDDPANPVWPVKPE